MSLLTDNSSFRHLIYALAVIALLGSFTSAESAAASFPKTYTPDAAFNSGNWVKDRFAGSTAANYQGRKLVVLPDGDTVVAGRVSWNGATDPNGSLQLGLVRYHANGQRATWNGPSSNPYFHNAKQYVVYPKNDPSIPATRFAEIDDIIYRGGFLYVLADVNYSPPNHAVFVFVFKTDGSYVGTSGVLGNFSEDPQGAALQVLPGFLFAPDQLLVVASRTPAGRPRTQSLVRMKFNADGSLAYDPMTNETDTVQHIKDIPVPIPGICNSIPVPFQCAMTASAVANSGVFGATYIGGSIQMGAGSSDWDFVVTKINDNGDVQGDFGVGGQATVALHPSQLGVRDTLTALLAEPVPDGTGFGVEANLYLVGEVPLSLGGGQDTSLAIAKLLPGQGYGTTLLDPAFASGGVWTTSDCRGSEYDDGVTCRGVRAAALANGRVTIGGWSFDSFFHDEAALLISVDAHTGTLVHIGNCFDGSSGCSINLYGSPRIYDLAALPEGHIIVTGTIFDWVNAYTQQFGTIRFKAYEHIFSSGFENYEN